MVHDVGHVFQPGRVVDGFDTVGHDIFDLNAAEQVARLVAGQGGRVRGRSHADVRIGDDAHDLARVVDDRQAAQIVVVHEVLQFQEGAVLIDRDDVSRHDVFHQGCHVVSSF